MLGEIWGDHEKTAKKMHNFTRNNLFKIIQDFLSLVVLANRIFLQKTALESRSNCCHGIDFAKKWFCTKYVLYCVHSETEVVYDV